MRVKLSDYLAQRLVEFGITHGFSVTGGGAMHLNDSLGHQRGLTLTYNHHEQASAIGAECYARIHQKMALLCVTTGPGGTNAITGVVGAWLDSIPMFVLSGQVRYDWCARSSGVHIRSMGDQEFDICRSIDCMTKYSEMVVNPLRIRFLLEKCAYLANVGRPGPVWLDIPLDVQSAFVETEELIGFDREDYERGGDGWGKAANPPREPQDQAGQGEYRAPLPPKVTEATVQKILEKIRHAKRPVLNAGNGIRIGDAHELFMEVARMLHIPVVVGWDSEDCMPVEDPLYVGRPGNFGDRPGNFAVQNADLVFSVGSRLSLRQVGFNYKGWAREAYTIVNDIDNEELKKPTLHVDMPVHAHCKDLLLEMKKQLEREHTPLWSGGEGIKGMNWEETCRYWRKTYPVCKQEFLQEDNSRRANVYAFIRAIGLKARENQITVVGNGSACVVGGHSYIIKKGQRFISNSAIASMGYDLPAAIGACIANAEGGVHERDVILITGDGSIQMNLQELQTIVHHHLPLKIFLINNEGYHSIRQTQRRFFGDRPMVGIGTDSGDLSFPDMEKIAAAYGIPFIRATTNSELEGAVEAAFAAEGPVICEAFVTKEQNFEPKSSGKQLPDGRMVSPPLEDLVPFLSDEEMAENMLVPRMEEI